MNACHCSPSRIPILVLACGACLGFSHFVSLTLEAAAPEPEDYAWRELAPLVSPSPRTDHAVAYDSRRSITVLFGGKDLEAVNAGRGFQEWSTWEDTALGDTWQFDGRIWWRLSPAHSPPAVYGHTMTYDQARGVVVLFGGKNGWRAGHPFNPDIWEWDGTDWTRVETSGEAPGGLVDHGMTYDRERAAHIVFGGFDPGFRMRGDTWEYDGAARTWTLRSQSGPAPRTQMGLAFDAARNRTVLFGGRTEHGDDFQYGDTWVWNGWAGTWTEHRGQDVPARLRVGLVYHAGLEAILSVGGIVEYIDYGRAGHPISRAWQPDTWSWEGVDWVRWDFANFCCLESPRAIVHEVGRQQLLLFDTPVGQSREGSPPLPRTVVLSASGNQPLPPILHVDPARVVEPQDGTFDHPFRTVRQAVDRAARGTVISIASGEYVEGPLQFATPGRVAATRGPVTLR